MFKQANPPAYYQRAGLRRLKSIEPATQSSETNVFLSIHCFFWSSSFEEKKFIQANPPKGKKKDNSQNFPLGLSVPPKLQRPRNFRQGQCCLGGRSPDQRAAWASDRFQGVEFGIEKSVNGIEYLSTPRA